MSQRSVLVAFLLFVVASFSGMVFYDLKHDHKLGKLFHKEQPAENWKWEDNWSKIPDNDPKSVKPNNDTQITAANYAESLQKSGDLGKPVLVFFTADWCSWCKKMKQETLADAKVQTVSKNYVFVYVDTDKDRPIAKKFGVDGLPSYVITNYKEDKLKSASGFKNADSFSAWLNDPSLFEQPKRLVLPPQKKDDKKDDRKDDRKDNRKRPFIRNEKPPQPNQPPMNPAAPG